MLSALLGRSGRGIGMVLLEVIRVAIVHHWSLRRRVLNRRRRIGVFDGVEHGVEQMRANDNVTGSNLGHGLFGRILPFDLLPFRLLGFGPISHQDSIA